MRKLKYFFSKIDTKNRKKDFGPLQKMVDLNTFLYRTTLGGALLYEERKIGSRACCRREEAEGFASTTRSNLLLPMEKE